MKVAIIGAGRMGRSVLRTLQHHSCLKEVIAYDPSPAALETVREELRMPVSGDLRTILEDSEVRLVFVTTPNHTHKELALAALRSGKAVMLEKPIATTLSDSEAVVAEAQRRGAFLQVGFELRYSKLYTAVKEWIDAGLLGKVVNIHCNYLCSEFHKAGSWRNTAREAGGMFGEKLSHYVDLPRWWTGSEVEEVYCASAPNVVPYMEVRDNYQATLRFGCGAVSHLAFMMYVAQSFNGDPLRNYVSQQGDDGHELRFIVAGTGGAAETDVFRRRLRRWEFRIAPEGLISQLVEERTWPEEDDSRYFHDTKTQALDVVDRVLRGLPPKTPPRDSLETMRVVDAAERSADSGQAVRLRLGRQEAATDASDASSSNSLSQVLTGNGSR